jgi:hypothetical protein
MAEHRSEIRRPLSRKRKALLALRVSGRLTADQNPVPSDLKEQGIRLGGFRILVLDPIDHRPKALRPFGLRATEGDTVEALEPRLQESLLMEVLIPAHEDPAGPHRGLGYYEVG